MLKAEKELNSYKLSQICSTFNSISSDMLPPTKTKKTARKSVGKLPRIPKISASVPSPAKCECYLVLVSAVTPPPPALCVN